MIYLKWLGQRLIFFKRILIEFQKRIVYQKESQFLLHRFNAHACPYESMLFYSFIGRVFFTFKEFMALITNNKIFKKSITLDGLEKALDYTSLYKQGKNTYLYPKSPMINVSIFQIDDSYYEKISKSLFLAYEYDKSNKDVSNEWGRISSEFKDLFFDKDSKLKKESLENFRGNPKIYSKIFNDQYAYISKKNSYAKNYLEAIDLVLEYHRYASKIDSSLLSSVSESSAGGYLSVNYRGKKLSDQVLLHMVVVNDIITHVPPLQEKREVIVDIGSGFGGVSRLLSYYRENSTQILVDLPETLMLTAYYIKYNFPHKKIALLEDIIDDLENFNEIILEYDFVIVPPFILEYIDKKSVDLVMNVASLAFMSKEYLDYYLEQIDRTLKIGGYFYSLNTTENSIWGIGSHHWNFKSNYLTISQGFDNRFSYPQWLAKKLSL
jgi:putative sugar O-methyltransferase